VCVFWLFFGMHALSWWQTQTGYLYVSHGFWFIYLVQGQLVMLRPSCPVPCLSFSQPY